MTFYKYYSQVLLRWIVFVFLVFFYSTVYGYQFTGVRASGMGGAGMALSGMNDSIYLNPASLMIPNAYVIGTDYFFANNENGSGYNVSIYDSRTSKLHAGIAFTSYDEKLKNNEREGHVWSLMTAYPVSSNIFFGIGGRYFRLNMDSLNKLNAATVDTGLLINFSTLAFSVSGQNLIYVGNSEEAPRKLSLGAAYTMSSYGSVVFDTVIDFDTNENERIYTYQGGVELILGEHFPLRAGYKYETFKTDIEMEGGTYSLGIGVEVPKLLIDASFEYDDDTKREIIVIGIKLIM